MPDKEDEDKEDEEAPATPGDSACCLDGVPCLLPHCLAEERSRLWVPLTTHFFKHPMHDLQFCFDQNLIALSLPAWEL